MKHSSNALRQKLAAAAVVAACMALPVPVLAQYHHGPPPAHYDHHDYHRDYHYDHYDRDYHHDNSGAIVAGALLGVAAGVAISNSQPQPPPTVVYTSPPPPPPPGVYYYDDGY